MTREQFQLALRAFYKRKPFQPFQLELISGSRVGVSHPEALTIQHELLVHRNTQGTHSVFSYESVVRFVDGTQADQGMLGGEP